MNVLRLVCCRLMRCHDDDNKQLQTTNQLIKELLAGFLARSGTVENIEFWIH